MLPRVLSERCPVSRRLLRHCGSEANSKGAAFNDANNAQKSGSERGDTFLFCAIELIVAEVWPDLSKPPVSVASPVFFGGCEEESIYLNSMQRGSSMCYHFGSASNIQQCCNVLHFPTTDSGHCTWIIMWMSGVWLSSTPHQCPYCGFFGLWFSLSPVLSNPIHSIVNDPGCLLVLGVLGSNGRKANKVTKWSNLSTECVMWYRIQITTSEMIKNETDV